MAFIDFFKDENHDLSMSRLLMFGSFIVTSFIMVKLTIDGAMNEGYFASFLGAFAGAYLVSKGIDAKRGKNAT